MRVAIVGVSGLIGSAVAAALRARGDEVVGVVRSARELPVDHLVVWDPSRDPAPDAVFAGCDAAVNLAGASIAQRWSEAAWREIVASRVDATAAVAAATARDGVAVLINGSAVGYYGSREESVDEAAAAGEGPLADLCVRWEAATQGAAVAGVRVVLLRTAVVLAREGGALERMLLPARLGLGGPLAGGRQWFPWVHIADAVAMVLWALDGAARGPVNVVAPESVRQRAFAATLGRVLHRPAFVPTPGIALRLLLGEGGKVLTEGQRVIPRVATENGYEFRFPQLEDALRDVVGATTG